MSKLDLLRTHFSLASQAIAERYPTKRQMKHLLAELEKLSPGEQERFERDT